jgi:hypothetical protein
MKTNLFIVTALLLSAASFGQQADTKTTQSETAQAATIKNGSDAGVQAYANTGIKSKAAGSIENPVIPAKKKVKKTSSSVEKKASGQAKSAIDKSQGATEGNTSAHASLQANSGANAGSGNNKLSQDASLNTGLKASSSDAKRQVDGLSGEGQATVHTKTNESLKTTASVKNEADKGIQETAGNAKTDMSKAGTTAKTRVETGSSTAVKAAGGIKQSVKPRPVSVKVHSKIKTNAGIRIK